MAKVNVPVKRPKVSTHEGGRAEWGNPLVELRRTLSSCLLFEDTFYESGEDIAARLASLADHVTQDELIGEILRAKEELKLRHAPLWMAVQLTRLHKGKQVGDVIARIIKRADELAEIIAMYYKQNGGKKPLTKQLKRGIASAFNKFDEYQLAKYNRDGEVKLRDAMFLTHPKPNVTSGFNKAKRKAFRTIDQPCDPTHTAEEHLFYKLAQDQLETPDTWEVKISAAKNKKEKKDAWTTLLKENKVGALALLRNLRNLEELAVDESLVYAALQKARVDGILPHQFIAAWRYAPSYSQAIEAKMIEAAESFAKLPGTTLLVIDVSGSMDNKLSDKSDITRLDGASAIAISLASISQHLRVFTFSDKLKEIPQAQGFGLALAIDKSQKHNGTWIGESMVELTSKMAGHKPADRLIIITDDQAHDTITTTPEAARKYKINCASYQYSCMTGGGFTKIDGLSMSVIRWLALEEKENLFND